MQNLKPMNSKEKKQVFEMLKSQYGFDEKLDYVFFFNEKEQKLFIANPEISQQALESFNLNSVGLYFGQFYKEHLRLSIEGSQIVGPKANKNILILDEHQKLEWLKGTDLDISEEEGFYLIKSGNDFLGTGKISGSKLFNFVPKARRVTDIS
ncbi:MAG: hypothetical protein Q8O89_07035 [Nanoarchaeota archaeon]|nr:hypothetical protein [Nanoarchaeota archaeon]